jgi:hypothetical protein
MLLQKLKIRLSLGLTLFLSILFLSNRIYSQDFAYSSRIEKTKKSGWNKIHLPALLRANADEHLNDLRLFDQQGKEVPYILYSQDHRKIKNDSLEFDSIKPDYFESRLDTPHKKTILKFTFHKAQWINQIRFKVRYPKYFYRELTVYSNKIIENKKGKKEVKEYIGSFILNASKPKVFGTEFFGGNFEIEIQNDDNPALEFETIQFYQLSAFLISDLRSEESYILKFGSQGLQNPQYDIYHFIDPETNMLVLKTMDIEKEQKQGNSTDKGIAAPKNHWFLWVSLTASVIIIFLFSMNLTREIRKKRNT